MNYSEILPAHWEVVEEDEPAKRKFSFFSDDGRDYSKPMFIRKDGLARIYFNEDETESSGYLLALSMTCMMMEIVVAIFRKL